MNHIRLLQHALSISLIFLLLIGCNACTVDVKPEAGLFQGSDDSPIEERIFALSLVVPENNSDVIESAELYCIGHRSIGSFPIGTNIEVKNARFVIETSSLIIQGQFVSPTKAKGTLRTKKDYQPCGITGEVSWVINCISESCTQPTTTLQGTP